MSATQIHFDCELCGSALVAPTEAGGRRTVCPKCRGVTTVPQGKASITDDDPAPDPLTLIQAASERAPIRVPSYRRSAPTFPEKVLGVLVWVNFAAGVVGAIYCFIEAAEWVQIPGALFERLAGWWLLMGVAWLAGGFFNGAFMCGLKLGLQYLRRTAEATEHLLNRPGPGLAKVGTK